jgi:hypothetical protein
VPLGAPCPTSALNEYPNLGLGLGTGPVWIYANDSPALTQWGGWAVYKFTYVSPSPGLALLRAKVLQTDQGVAFAANPLGPSSMSLAGRALGSDNVNGYKIQARAEAVFQDEAHAAAINRSGERAPLTIMVGVQRGDSRCVGLQFDGPGFTENMVIAWSGSGL